MTRRSQPLSTASPQVASVAQWHHVDSPVSDHIATVIQITNSFNKIPDTQRLPRQNMNKAKWKIFRDKLHDLSSTVLDPTISVYELHGLSADLYEAATLSIPLSTHRPFRSPRSFLPPEAKKWTGEVSRPTKIFIASRTTENKAELRAAQKEARRQHFIMKAVRYERQKHMA